MPEQRPSVTWEDPPPLRSNGTAAVLAIMPLLRDNPRTWALIFEGGSHACHARAQHLRAAGCETRVTSKIGTAHRRRVLYARWMPS